MLKDIQEKLEQEFAPHFIKLRDDSDKHAGHSGWKEGEVTHLHIVIVSQKFEGLSQIKRHQYIYRVLGEEMKSNLHAVSIKSYSIEEYQKLS